MPHAAGDRICDAVSQELASLDSPHAVAELFAELKKLCHAMVQRDSTCGKFLRRQVLDFDRLMFDGVSTLFNSLQRHGLPRRAEEAAPSAAQFDVRSLVSPFTEFGAAEDTLHRTLDRALCGLGEARATPWLPAGAGQRGASKELVTQHASLHLAALHLARGQLQLANTGEEDCSAGARMRSLSLSLSRSRLCAARCVVAFLTPTSVPCLQ
jgi:hypothetical protein